MERGHVAVVRAQAKNTRAAISVKRLKNDIAVARLEFAKRIQIPGNHGWRREVGELKNQQFLGIVPDPERIVHDKRFRMDQIKQMAGGDVAHVEGRILPQPDHVDLGQINGRFGLQMDVIPLYPLNGHTVTPRRQLALIIGQLVGRVIEQLVTPCLRLFRKAKAAVGVDIHAFDRVHLEGNFHGFPIPCLLRLSWRRVREGSMAAKSYRKHFQ